MPHCIVEHSNDLDSDLLVQKVFFGTLDSSLFKSDGSDIKVRAKSFDSYLVGSHKSAFVHVVLKILSGRTSSQKKDLSQSVIERLQTINLENISITVEVVDIDRDSYKKVHII